MNLENQEQYELNAHAEARQESQKFTISYTRDFLLSLSGLDVCKKLPSGFDESILSEFEDASQDRFRISGGLTSQSYRRNDYSSSPPTRGDGSRSIHGRWDSRSSGRSDRDSDSQSDLDSDSAKRGNQSRRAWQVPEHDGLLGSGSFPRPAGYVTGTSVPKTRANDQYPLNRSNEPYHPPRPYKAVPHSRREINDSLNDETFGSSEYTSEDRAEEERKRRASFELMRKEQHKSFQEKQKNPEKRKDSFDFSELVDDPKDNKKFLNKRNESDEPVTSNNDSDKSSVPSAAPISRPLVPPGFSSPIVEKNIGNKSLTHPQPLEIGNESDGRLFHAKGNSLLSGDSNNQEEKLSLEEIDSRGELLGGPSIRFSVNKRSEKILNPSLGADISKYPVNKDNQSKVLEPLEGTESTEIMEHDANDVLGSKIVGESRPAHSTSILDKLFGSALTLNGVGPSSITERNDVKVDDSWSPHMVQSSKFAQWFLEEEKKPIDDLSSSWPNEPADDFFPGRPNKPVDEPSFFRTTKSIDDLSSGRSSDLLSLIVGGEKSGSLIVGGENGETLIVGGEKSGSLIDVSEKSGSQVFDDRATENILPSFPLQLSGIADGHVMPNSMLGNVETIDKLEAVPAVLTCEDLEQSIMSEITEIAPVLQPHVEGWNGLVADAEQKKAGVDNHASQHLLSLLQKGAEPFSGLGIVSSDRQNIEVENLGTTFHDSMETENISNAGKPLTLETLFGTAFMKELKSVGAPTSAQRGPSESLRVDNSESSFPMVDNILGSTADIASSIPGRGNSVLASNQRPHATPETIGQRLLGFDIQSKVDPSELRTEFRSKLGGFDGSAGSRLPEEDSLIAANDSLNLQNFMSGRNLAKAELLSRPERAVGVAEKLAALNSVYQDERTMIGGQEGPAIFRGPYDMREPDVQYHSGQEGPGIFRGPYDMREPDVQYHKIHGQSSSPQLRPSQLNHGGPRFHPLDSHPANSNAQMKFMAPENIIHHDPPNHQFPANMVRPSFHHPNTGMTGLDPNPHNPMLQQMHIPGNFPPHLLRGFPRGASMSPHPNNQATNFMQEPNLMQGFPFGQKPPSFGGPGIPPQGGDVGGGGHHPEALQRLIEMELRSNAKQIHPFSTAGHNRGVYGNELLDMGFEFR
ncbi:uncharacterized protein [Euphorbia lathyris]|uniref:uncharacterized protein isoform X2 n=1 Tax=Euphorbia lathyris TaxID=212925 RepID=UPI0033134118